MLRVHLCNSHKSGTESSWHQQGSSHLGISNWCHFRSKTCKDFGVGGPQVWQLQPQRVWISHYGSSALPRSRSPHHSPPISDPLSYLESWNPKMSKSSSPIPTKRQRKTRCFSIICTYMYSIVQVMAKQSGTHTLGITWYSFKLWIKCIIKIKIYKAIFEGTKPSPTSYPWGWDVTVFVYLIWQSAVPITWDRSALD
jgi:hypothetical protein